VVALAYLLHGLYLLTSVGIGIARQARYYPMVTALAATAGVTANLQLIPRYEAMGAAWAMVLAYAVMALAGHAFSRRVFPIPFEGGRFLRLTAAAGAAFALSAAVPGEGMAAAGLRATALLVYPVLAWALGTLNPGEKERLRRIFDGKG
jgi:O-antigen/teichoic acid export membrane protein